MSFEENYALTKIRKASLEKVVEYLYYHEKKHFEEVTGYDGDEELLQEIATRVAQRHDTTASIERMRDPGLGLILPKDIEAMDREMFRVNVSNSEE